MHLSEVISNLEALLLRKTQYLNELRQQMQMASFVEGEVISATLSIAEVSTEEIQRIIADLKKVTDI